jgi:hypothetical protein
MAHFRGFALALSFVGLAVIAVLMWTRHEVRRQLARRVADVLNERLASAGYHVTIRSATWDEGRGIRIEGLALRDSATNRSEPLVVIDDVFVESPLSLKAIMLGQMTIQAVRLSHASLRVERSADGRLNIDKLARILSDACPGGGVPAPVTIRDATLAYHDPHLWTDRALVVRHIQLQIAPRADQPQSVAVMGSAMAADFLPLAIEGQFDRPSCAWHCVIAVAPTALESGWRELLPESVTGHIDPDTNVRGTVDAMCRIAYAPSIDASIAWIIEGHFADSTILDKRVPSGLTEASGSFRLAPDGLAIWDVRGRCAGGTLSLSYEQIGLAQPQSWQVAGQLAGVNIDEHAQAALPAAAQKLWTDFRPAGRVNVNFTASRQGDVQQFDAQAKVMDGSLTYHRFPFRLNHCSGTIHWNDRVCQFDLRAVENNQNVHLRGDIANPGRHYTGWVEFGIDGLLAIDEKLLAAMDSYPRVGTVVRSLNLHGHIGVRGRMERADPSAPKPTTAIDVELVDCDMRSNRFAYPLNHLNGWLRIRDQRVAIDNVRGQNAATEAVMGGVWDQQNGLVMTIDARSVALDEQLKLSLSPAMRRVWRQLEPSGTLDVVHVDLRNTPGGGRPHAVVTAESFAGSADHAGGLTIQPLCFPYQLTDIACRFRAEPGLLVIESFTGRHGRATFSARGSGSSDAHHWRIDLQDILASGLQLDNDLVEALPEQLARRLRAMDVQANLNLSGRLGVEMPIQSDPRDAVADAASPLPEDPAVDARLAAIVPRAAAADSTDLSSATIHWQVRCDVADGRIEVGMPIEHAAGAIHLDGRYAGGQLLCRGQLELDSAMISGVQITTIRGPLLIDDRRTAIGTLVDNRPAELVAPQLGQSVVGQVFGGQLMVDGEFLASEAGEFYVQGALDNARLEQLTRELAPRLTGLVGNASAGLRLAGDRSGQQSLRGQGYVRLAEARMYQLPVIVALVKVLSSGDPNPSAFDSSNMDFTLNGDVITFDRIEMIGDAMSLLGNGQLRFDQQINLNFYSVMGRNNLFIPVLTDLYRASSQQILWIRVDGTLSQPRTHRDVLPGLNESLEQLFGGLEPAPRR